MLLSISCAPRPVTAILCGMEHEMAHGIFGDRDAGRLAPGRPMTPGCGLFGRLADAPKIPPANPARCPAGTEDRPPPRGNA